MNTAGPHRFADRLAAGSILGELLAAQGFGTDTVVLGLLRGGVPVAAPVAARLGAALGALAVRKLGIPDEPEVAFGAVASYRRQRVMYHVPRIHEYAVSRYSPAALAAVERHANTKLLRLASTFDAFAPDCAGRTVVLCDDGLATGATMTAALRVVSRLEPDNLVVAVPVAPAKVLRELSAYADAVVCFLTPPDFSSVGTYYEDFSQVSEPEIIRLLAESGTTQ
ncbi:phosphoribosyltransferase [Paeniglutamicibacter kerguelensis]|uniref:Phosphoribosyl transferase n=1 Tax=Paeniglutamicibacter kerguelensis TaxID=254788 RepID=A0ABS4XAT4_9MICC|nr:phosphoribosyltransferase family protein [Paeniglutamicibacter kerguelensis]MBP2385488.1 putative phosphoribosyl transferase [Paeniglutamicibacter kerguelensis]